MLEDYSPLIIQRRAELEAAGHRVVVATTITKGYEVYGCYCGEPGIITFDFSMPRQAGEIKLGNTLSLIQRAFLEFSTGQSRLYPVAASSLAEARLQQKKAGCLLVISDVRSYGSEVIACAERLPLISTRMHQLQMLAEGVPNLICSQPTIHC